MHLYSKFHSDSGLLYKDLFFIQKIFIEYLLRTSYNPRHIKKYEIYSLSYKVYNLFGESKQEKIKNRSH